MLSPSEAAEKETSDSSLPFHCHSQVGFPCWGESEMEGQGPVTIRKYSEFFKRELPFGPRDNNEYHFSSYKWELLGENHIVAALLSN